ncbi:MAG: zinc metalloprotease [Deltaproteobacteria bacterium]|nr:zinc metalloprotease [Deltaproteobacteria bacterium]
MQVHFRLLETHPGFREAQFELEQQARRAMRTGPAAHRTGIVRIPVVVHVVYEKPEQNITLAQIRSQIRVLNRDFRAKNKDRLGTPQPWQGLVADAAVEFFLARQDPDGKPTKGVTRTKTARASFGTGDTVKAAATGGADPWPTDCYLNIWVCKLGGGLLGYAQFPGGPAQTDGVVILHRAFGTKGTAAAPFNLGRTTTHEVGHWLNLRHIWGDTEDCSGTDYVEDTPNAALPNYGVPAFPSVSCNNGPNGDMFMNYMDYVDDRAMYMFTSQQVARMRAALDGPRAAVGG